MIRLLYLYDKYEYDLISSTGKLKKEYIGQIGKVIHTCVIRKDHYVKPILYDVQFGGGMNDDLFYCRIFYRWHIFNVPLFLSCFRTNQRVGA